MLRAILLAAFALCASALTPSRMTMKSTEIKVGSMVKIMAGDDKGLTGKVTQIDRRRREIRKKHVLKVMEGPFVLVEGVNVKTKHVKPTTRDKVGEIKQLESPIHISNVKAVEDVKA
ncbi:hypothetical protein M885DRAFT_530760 [Pelagophyceae sp. CCMP2097]|nr:hypothetical protein M885DRAFT_530760 [Pelagophyceae sp. CCMP2097]